ncbi:MAG: AAA family ATPase [Acidimicrobiales bacterium]
MTVVRQGMATARGFHLVACFEAIASNMGRVIQGRDEVIRLALVCLMSEGHLLIEDVPGVGKTSLAKALALSIDCQWSRIQFTPDLLPSDITGVNVYNRARSSFEFRPGGIFANIVVGDEINRASPKTQSALLEAMEEGQVSIDGSTYALPAPFMVVATQNPLGNEGTYPLPESQLDRFLMRTSVGYPPRGDEIAMLDTHSAYRVIDTLGAVAGPDDVAAMVEVARATHVATAVKGYVVDLARVSRAHPDLSLGMSPRAALALLKASRAWAAASGRDFVTPDDVKAMVRPVLSHRVVVSPEVATGGSGPGGVLDDIVARLPVPGVGSLR